MRSHRKLSSFGRLSRGRMYSFERAYVGYVRRSSYSWLCLACWIKGIWRWFWKGKGSQFAARIAQAVLVIVGIGLFMAYIRFEGDLRRQFSDLAVFGVAAIVWSSIMSLSFFKTPLHYFTCLSLGVTASAVILVFGLIVTVPVAVFCVLYLAVLMILTVCSLILILPLRAGQELWLLSRKLGYHCPNDDCICKGLPIHICECGEKYHDLLPSFYGILHHTCRHEDKDVKLPTLDLLGRRKLTRLCGGCQRPLIHSSIGELEVRPIAVVGGTSAGKTVLLIQAIRLLREQLASSRRSAVKIDSERQERFLEKQNALLDTGQVLAKTAGDVMEAIGLAVRAPEMRLRCLLHLFDAPGEKFTTMQRLGQMQVMTHLKGIVLLVDPFGLPVLADRATMLGQHLKPSEAPFATIVDNIINAVNLLVLENSQNQCTVPVAVVLSKADAFPTDTFPFLKNLTSRNGDPTGEQVSQRCRDALAKLGAKFTIEKLEQKFTNIHYFACSALGRMPNPRDTSPFQPAGVVEPFLWLLGRKGAELAKTK